MWPDLVLNPGPLALESDALPTAPRGPAKEGSKNEYDMHVVASLESVNHTPIRHYEASKYQDQLVYQRNKPIP